MDTVKFCFDMYNTETFNCQIMIKISYSKKFQWLKYLIMKHVNKRSTYHIRTHMSRDVSSYLSLKLCYTTAFIFLNHVNGAYIYALNSIELIIVTRF